MRFADNFSVLGNLTEWIRDRVDLAREYFRERPAASAVATSSLALAACILVASALGFPPGFRMAYVFPVWFATKKGGRQAGAFLVLATSLCLSAIDAAHPIGAPSPLANFAIQTIVLYALMHVFDIVESHLRDATTRAMRDPLTGLFNRTEIERRARKSIDRATIHGTDLAVAMIDCDRFKELNDRYGHRFGDEVLRHLARELRRSVPKETILGRPGGDEFIVIAPGHDREAVTAMLDQALDRFTWRSELAGRTAGFSYGVATLGRNGLDFDRLIEAADQDMYRRKYARAAAIA